MEKNNQTLSPLGYDEKQFITSGDNFKVYNVDTLDKMYDRFHEHDFIEIFILLSGSVTYTIEQGKYELKDFDIIIVPPHKLHTLNVLRKDIAYKRMVLWIKKDYLNSLSSSNTNLYDGMDLCNKTNKYLIRNPEFTFLIKPYLQKIIQLQKENLYGCDLLIENNIRSLFITMNSFLIEIEKNNINAISNPIVNKTIKYIEEHLNEDLSLSTISKNINYDFFYIERTFKELIGLSVHKYIIKKRLNYARELLNKNIRVKDVLEKIGFKDESYFIQVFKKEFGYTPKKYIQKMK